MQLTNKVLIRLFDLLLFPFKELNPMWGLVWVSGLTGILVLCVYKFFSNQKDIEAVKNRLKAYLLEMRLFQDDPAQMLQSIRGIMIQNLRYGMLNLRPFLCMLIPILLIMIQLDTRFGYRPLRVGEAVLFSIVLDPHLDGEKVRTLRVEASDGIRIDSPPIHIPMLRKVTWRIRATSIGSHPITITSPDGVHSSRVLVSSSLVPVFPKSFTRGSLHSFLHPTDSPFESASVYCMEIAYPLRTVSILADISAHWIVMFFLFTLLAGFGLKHVLRVRI